MNIEITFLNAIVLFHQEQTIEILFSFILPKSSFSRLYDLLTEMSIKNVDFLCEFSRMLLFNTQNTKKYVHQVNISKKLLLHKNGDND